MANQSCVIRMICNRFHVTKENQPQLVCFPGFTLLRNSMSTKKVAITRCTSQDLQFCEIQSLRIAFEKTLPENHLLKLAGLQILPSAVHQNIRSTNTDQ